MIDPKDYPFHVNSWKEAAPWDNENHIKEILDGEEQAQVSMSMWSNPYMR